MVNKVVPWKIEKQALEVNVMVTLLVSLTEGSNTNQAAVQQVEGNELLGNGAVPQRKHGG